MLPVAPLLAAMEREILPYSPWRRFYPFHRSARTKKGHEEMTASSVAHSSVTSVAAVAADAAGPRRHVLVVSVALTVGRVRVRLGWRGQIRSKVIYSS